MDQQQLISRRQLALRWGVNAKTIDRLRQRGLLPWMDLNGCHRKKSLVRFSMSDIQTYEDRNRMAQLEEEVERNALG